MNPETSGGAAKPAHTRAAFQAAQERAQKVEQSGGTPLALVAVVLGFGQLYLLRWAKDHLAREQMIPLATAVFVVYLVLVGALLARMVRARNAAAPCCPQCGVSMRDLSQRVALATGKCDRCGGQVIEPA
ncbi:MAG: hypothetical protein ABL977_04785 [Candidatus Eisenbacteria bacterium]